MNHLEIAMRVAELRGRFPDDERVQRVAGAAGEWLDEWWAFRQMPWYRQMWLVWCDRIPRYRSPFRVTRMEGR